MPTKTKEINEENIKPTKKTTAKKGSKTSTAKNSVTKKSSTTTRKNSTTKKSTTTKKNTTTKKTTSTKKAKTVAQVVEYYDLPYRYNETIVKILYQTPDTLFVYWDISDKDRENYVKQYGENFFNITRPVLIIHNDTMNYSFEVPINDFANSWYLHINDSKCNYSVELGRRPNHYNEEATKEIQENIHTDYIYVSDSNKIESPNDHILFSTNENNTIKFKNIKNNDETSVSLYEFVKHLPAMKNDSNIPYVKKEIFTKIYAGIENKDISLFDKVSNPSSGTMSAKF